MLAHGQPLVRRPAVLAAQLVLHMGCHLGTEVAPTLGHQPYRGHQRVGLGILGRRAAGAGLYRQQCVLLLRVHQQHQDRQRRRLPAYRRQHIQPAAPFKVDVGQHQVEALIAQRDQGRGTAARLTGHADVEHVPDTYLPRTLNIAEIVSGAALLGPYAYHYPDRYIGLSGVSLAAAQSADAYLIGGAAVNAVRTAATTFLNGSAAPTIDA